MALGTATTALMFGLGAVGASKGLSSIINKGMSQASAPLPMPQAPSVSDAQGKAEDIIKKKRASATQSIYTSPLGVSGEAKITKTLLGT